MAAASWVDPAPDHGQIFECLMLIFFQQMFQIIFIKRLCIN